MTRSRIDDPAEKLKTINDHQLVKNKVQEKKMVNLCGKQPKYNLGLKFRF